MIKFHGKLNEKTLAFGWNNSKKIATKFLFAAFLILSPFPMILAFNIDNWSVIIGFAAIPIVCALLFLIVPREKKHPSRVLPTIIFTEEEYIVYQCGTREEFREISKAEKLIDYGEFYYISFTFGNKSDNFICQKNLLVEGTLEEFEALFEGKIERHKDK